jgi:NTE family protein
MLFHIGALWRLNELGYLPKLFRISAVSGGAIVAGVLALKWEQLGFDSIGIAQRFCAEVVSPVSALANKTIDVPSVVQGILLRGSIAERLAGYYRRHLFGNAMLQDLPQEPPRFVINASNVHTGGLFRFSQSYVADDRLRKHTVPKVELALAVAASSAFPPFLSPCRLTFPLVPWQPPTGKKRPDVHQESVMTTVVLTDGGVYDNLALETALGAYKTLLVSDGGLKIRPQERPRGGWLRHAIRANDMIDNQVRTLRKRLLSIRLGSASALERTGALGLIFVTTNCSIRCPVP